jgi:hypothetical protein
MHVEAILFNLIESHILQRHLGTRVSARHPCSQGLSQLLDLGEGEGGQIEKK